MFVNIINYIQANTTQWQNLLSGQTTDQIVSRKLNGKTALSSIESLLLKQSPKKGQVNLVTLVQPSQARVLLV